MNATSELMERARALLREQALVDAQPLLAKAHALGVADADVLNARTSFAIGLPSAALFADARRVDRGIAATTDAHELLRHHAAALAAEGDPTAADAMLAEALHAAPDWLEGHRALAMLRWTMGDAAHFAQSYEDAVRAVPTTEGLWIAYFGALAQAKRWTDARVVLDRAMAAIGRTAALDGAAYVAAVEDRDDDAVAALTPTIATMRGDAVDLARVRHAIRHHDFAAAEKIAISLLLTPSARLFWPYLSLIWRATDDVRWQWLDRPDLIRTVAVDLTAAELDTLADTLRGLHVMARPYAEQSVRGGTQTDRSVILRHEPILQRARAAWIAAIQHYVDDLPPFEQGHPLLGTPRAPLRIEGSWSVRLSAQGHNVPHSHPHGWLSTAFYIALPSTEAMGAAPAGHLVFGGPPDDLGLDLEPYATITPVVGETAIFPSTTWHGTVPFSDGERLVMALDISVPQGTSA